MILVDANLLLYAENESDVMHLRARDWWVAQLSGTETVCLPWLVLCAFIRIGTSPRVFPKALSMSDAIARVQDWVEWPNVRVIAEAPTHWQTLRLLLEDSGARGNLVTDAHLAAMAIDHGCELCSVDRDFARFKRLKWRDPLE